MITAYRDADFTAMLPQSGNPSAVWVDPASYRHDFNRRCNDASPPADPFDKETIHFGLMFEANGPMPESGLAGILAKFQQLVARMEGATHHAHYLKLSWARLQFHGVLRSMTISHHLFRSNGTPLRAKIMLALSGFTAEAPPAKPARALAPNVSHLITVTAGDTLPGLCQQIYGDSRYCLKIAAFNGITGFRRLMPGMQLLFPPITGSL